MKHCLILFPFCMILVLSACRATAESGAEDTPPTLSELDAPQGLVLEVADPYAIRLSWIWNPTSGNAQIEIGRKAAGESSFKVMTTLPAASESWMDEGLLPESTYSYRVRLSKENLFSLYTDALTATTYPVVAEGAFLILDTLFAKGSQGQSTCPSRFLAYSTDSYSPSRFGGSNEQIGEATGRFRVVLTNDGWTFVDPEGYRFFAAGVNSVPEPDNFSKIKLPANLKELGINHLANWSAYEKINAQGSPMPYTTRELFLQGYKNEAQRTKDLFDKGIIPVFDPGFEVFSEQLAMETAGKYVDDPWCIGIFTDNELPLYSNEKYGDLLGRFLSIPDTADANYRAARDWLVERKGTTDFQVTEEDRYDWHGYLASHYYRIVYTAIKKHAPELLILGSRLHGAAKDYPNIFVDSAPWVDVFSINFYGPCEPPTDQLQYWSDGVDKPYLISEFYAKGFDVPLDNSGGAGLHVPGQKERALYFENFALRVMQEKNCIGYQWFRFQDDASNKGLVDASENWYAPLVSSFKKINRDLYQLIDFLRNE